ncbi:MAG TPA: acyl-CoA dehydrogenase family protein [Candidatus Binatia bacterium]|nr:acyl-CoA dehydrogenase family protein [Candidatus Binatia bacterium]
MDARTIADMQEAGVFRVLQPKRWGGFEMDLRTYFEVQIVLGEGDMSAAWIYGVVGVHPWLMALLDDRAAQDVWGKETSVLISSSLAPMGKATPADGGFILNGRWKYSSGCEHCDWSFLGAIVQSEKPGLPDQRHFLVPRKDYEIVDTWNVPGLRATGSHDIVVHDVFVPGYRVQALVDSFNLVGPGQAVNASPLYRLPFGQIFVRGVSTAAIGALRGLLDALLEYGSVRVSRAGGRTAEDPVAQLACAETTAAIDEMKAVLFRTFDTLTRYAHAGQTPPLAERLQYKFQSAYVPERCMTLASRLFKLTGAAGISADLPFGRILNDITIGRQHLANQFEYYGRNWGATMFGLEHNRDLMM